MTVLPTLTRKAQVLDVLRAGGFVVAVGAGMHQRLAYLFAHDGTKVPAWQTAINSCLAYCVSSPIRVNGSARRWTIKP